MSSSAAKPPRRHDPAELARTILQAQERIIQVNETVSSLLDVPALMQWWREKVMPLLAPYDEPLEQRDPERLTFWLQPSGKKVMVVFERRVR